MKSLLTGTALLLTTICFSQQLVKDTVYLEWREGKFFEVTESLLDNGQRQLNEKPVGDSIETVRFYVENTERTFNALAEAARIVIQKNVIIQNTSKINSMLSNTFNTDLVLISKTGLSQAITGDYKLKMPDVDVVDAKLDKDLVLTYGDNTVQVIPVGSSYIQLIVEDDVYELYRIGEGQYASLDVQTVLIKNETK